MSMLWRWLRAFGRFWYGFVIGDDWTLAATVAAALAVTWGLHTAGVAAWWLPPFVAVVAVGHSLRRTGSTSTRPSAVGEGHRAGSGSAARRPSSTRSGARNAASSP